MSCKSQSEPEPSPAGHRRNPYGAGRRVAPIVMLAATLAACCPSPEEQAETMTGITPEFSMAPGVQMPRKRPVPSAAAVDAARAKPRPAALATQATSTPEAAAKVNQLAAGIAADLAERCPISDPADQNAFNACRNSLHGASKIRASLADFTLWGRQHSEPEKPLRDTNLTQFGPDVLTGMYLPLFMYRGNSSTSFNERENLYRVELGVRMRNRLAPGQFPYPFWHEEAKWATYENANAIILWVDPKKMNVRTVQFTPRGTLEPASDNTHVAQAAFDGKWMWTDADGKQQPKVTLFDGLFRAENPHIQKLDASYRELALTLREGQCMSCHVPNNPNKMKKLVLLQTPAHAAAEIKRVMETVRKGSMPLEETTGLPDPLKGARKDELLKRAKAFEKIIDEAKAWEAATAKPRRSAALKSTDGAPAQ